MHITLRQLAVFDAVARTGSVSQASAEIALSQSAASLSLKELERHLGGALFERRGKKLVLNENGRRLHPRANALLRQAKDIYLTEDSRTLRGTLKISASPTIGHYVLPAICGAFLKEHPKVQLDLDISSSLEVVSKVLNVSVDLGVIEGPCNQKALQCKLWLRDKLVFFAAPSHRLAGKASISIHELADDVWFLEPVNFVTRTVALSTVVTHLQSVNIGFVSSSVEAIKRAVRSSNGVGCLSELALVEELRRGELVALPVQQIQISRVFSILMREDEYHGELFQAFEKFLVQHEPAPAGPA